MKLEPGLTALVTGASRGLGAEIAERLAAQGLDLILSARSLDALQPQAAALRARHRVQVATVAADVGSRNGIDALALAAGAADILVNNAGVEGAQAFDQRDPDEIAQTLAVNLTGPMLLTRALLPGMIARGRGHIVNIASVAGLIAVPFNEPYSASKFGLVGFTRALRQTAQAQGWAVSASVVCPGFIDGAGMFETLKQDHGVSATEMGATPLERLGPAVIEAIERNLPDIIVANGDIRQAAAHSVLEPGAFEAASAASAASEMFRSVAAARGGG